MIAKLSDTELIQNTKAAVIKEKAALLDVLYHFKEIEHRRLYSDLGYESLYKWAVHACGYSEYEAYSRIQAMRLLKELPGLKEQIKDGTLNLTTLTYAQSLFKQERYQPARKIEVLRQLEGKTTREVKNMTLSLSSSPQALRPDKITIATADKIEIRFTAPALLEKKIARLRGRLAHKNPGMALGELFEMCVDQALAKIESIAPKKRRVMREVFAQARKQCELCRSTYMLEVDHITPKAKGGGDELSNLRVLCRNCNQRAAIREFGQQKMDQYRS